MGRVKGEKSGERSDSHKVHLQRWQPQQLKKNEQIDIAQQKKPQRRIR